MRGRGREEGQMLVMERVHAKRSWEGVGEGETFVVESRHMRGEGEKETFVVESRHMRGEGRTNVCGADRAFKND